MTVGCLEAERQRSHNLPHNRGAHTHTHTCFVVDQLQNERSAGDDARSSRKEVPEQAHRGGGQNSILIQEQRLKYYTRVVSRSQPRFKTASCSLMGDKKRTSQGQTSQCKLEKMLVKHSQDNDNNNHDFGNDTYAIVGFY